MIESDEYNLIDKTINNQIKIKTQIRDGLNQHPIVFYNKWLAKLNLNYILASFLVGLFFFLLHYIVGYINKVNIYTDYSFLVSIMIALNCYLVFAATERLKEFVINLVELTDITMEEYEQKYHALLVEISKSLPKCGIFFAIINPFIGIIYGHWYSNLYMSISLFIQHSVIGFTCGIALGGIIAVVKLVQKVGAKEKLKLDYYAPDKCAGTLIIGKVLFYFAIYTLIMGIFIAAYINISPWTHRHLNLYVDFTFYLWTALPFVASIAVFVLPVFRLHQILLDFKKNEQVKVRKMLHHINEKILLLNPDTKDFNNKLQSLKTHYDQIEKIDNLLENLNTWPYNSQYKVTYTISLLAPILPIIFNKILK